MIKNFFSRIIRKIHEINTEYKTPGIQMSDWVKFSLLLLRLYLVTLIGLSLYKFITMLH
ncbi:MAG: hypothetical protein M1491_08830 [Deltaproteobacteria bacterium]|nr:hypothetical protein [Deltaproteobacteria bacterium]MCL5277979.1 hypothetical protein [Deltaproteobacteria bacterium]